VNKKGYRDRHYSRLMLTSQKEPPAGRHHRPEPVGVLVGLARHLRVARHGVARQHRSRWFGREGVESGERRGLLLLPPRLRNKGWIQIDIGCARSRSTNQSREDRGGRHNGRGVEVLNGQLQIDVTRNRPNRPTLHPRHQANQSHQIAQHLESN